MDEDISGRHKGVEWSMSESHRLRKFLLMCLHNKKRDSQSSQSLGALLQSLPEQVTPSALKAFLSLSASKPSVIDTLWPSKALTKSQLVVFLETGHLVSH